MERLLFFLVIAGILWTFYLYTPTEGFQDSGLNVPLAGPPVAQLPGDAQPFNPPSTTLLAPPPGQIASVGSKPYEDPAMQKASANRINNVYVTLQGFLQNEAPNIQKMSDPSIQLPLATARSDANRLNDELLVLKRNPGIQSSLTVEDVNGVEANLGYLQKKWRLSANSVVEPFQSAPKNTFFSFFSSWFSAEGFEDPPATDAPKETETAEETEEAEASYTDSDDTDATSTDSSYGGSPPAPNSDPVTLNDLTNLSSRIAVEIIRLNASGSTDQVVQGRVDTLTQIKTKIDDMIDQVQKGYKKIEDIPLTQSEIATFLPIMSNLSSPVPQILNTTGMNPVLQNLFQTYSGGDAEGGAAAQAMFDKYAGMLLNNISWELNLSYMGKAEQDMSKQEAASVASLVNLLQGSTVVEFDDAPESSYPGQMQALVKAMAGPGGPGSLQGLPQGLPQGLSQGLPQGFPQGLPQAAQKAAQNAAPRGPALPTPYDWKPRTAQICQQIAARGMTPGDFGCVDPSSVSDNFSWRGNAKMICNRIATLYDPSIPAACGCPPVGWPGWRA